MSASGAIAVALSAFVVFAYHSAGAIVLFGRPDVVPRAMRHSFLVRSRAVGVLRAASLGWVLFASAASQLVVGWALLRELRGGHPLTVGVLATELLLAILWVVLITNRWINGSSTKP